VSGSFLHRQHFTSPVELSLTAGALLTALPNYDANGRDRDRWQPTMGKSGMRA
jgi:hypothetical protein